MHAVTFDMPKKQGEITERSFYCDDQNKQTNLTPQKFKKIPPQKFYKRDIMQLFCVDTTIFLKKISDFFSYWKVGKNELKSSS